MGVFQNKYGTLQLYVQTNIFISCFKCDFSGGKVVLNYFAVIPVNSDQLNYTKLRKCCTNIKGIRNVPQITSRPTV